MKTLFQIQNASVFQGNLNKKFYFEGWYYKLVSKDQQNILAIIPGIALNKKENNSHAFIQVLDGSTADYHYIQYPLEEFETSKKEFFAKVRDNYFDMERISLNIEDEEVSLKGTLELIEAKPLPFKGLSPGVMGWFSYFPFMECNHGVVSMDHQLKGTLSYNGKKVDFTGGKGYIEKDWGRSFPKNWIWMQSNNFKEENRSIIVSIANIPFLGTEFAGFLAVLYDRGKFYRFGSFNRAKFTIEDISPVQVRITIKRKNQKFVIDAKKNTGDQSKTALMKAPSKGIMTSKCAETIQGIIDVKFYIKEEKERKLIFEDTGTSSGLEIMGEKEDF